MSDKQKLEGFWPPRGWKQFGFIKKLSAQAIFKDPVLAVITGMNYKIETVPTYNNENSKRYVYRLSIKGWDYSIQNESREYNILSFDFQERVNKLNSKKYYISNIKIKSRPIRLTQHNAQRVCVAAIFLIKKIEAGQVADFKKILRLYKLYPSQTNAFADRPMYPLDSKNCGLEFCNESFVKAD